MAEDGRCPECGSITVWEGVCSRCGWEADADEGDDAPLPEIDEDVPDHQNEALLARLYDEAGGSIKGVVDAHDFEVTYFAVRNWLIEFGIHEPGTYGVTASAIEGSALETSGTGERVDGGAVAEPDGVNPGEADEAAETPAPAPAPDPEPVGSVDRNGGRPEADVPRWERDWSQRTPAGEIGGVVGPVPEGVTAERLRAAVREDDVETIGDVCQVLGLDLGRGGVGRGGIRQALHNLGLYDDLDDPERDDRGVVV